MVHAPFSAPSKPKLFRINAALKNLLILPGLALSQNVLAQAPVITYNPSAIYVTGTIPFTISPTNTGGAVPAVVYGQVTTFAGSPTGMRGFVDGVGTAALFNNSQDMALDAAGNLYVADASNNAIREISPAGVVTTFAGSHTGVAGFTDGQDTSARFNYPDGLAFDTLGNLFVSDYNNSAIRKITPGGMVTTFYQNTAILFDPQALFFDSAGNLIFGLQYGDQVVKLSPSAVLTIIAGVNRVPGSTDGVGTAALFAGPVDTRLNAAGNLIVADSRNNEMRSITPDGTVTTIAGSANSTVLYANGPALAARFNFLTGVEIGPGGIIYIVDLLNNDIRTMMPDGTVSLLAGSPSQTPGNADGILTAAQFDQPCYLRIDKTGTGYIAEWGLGGASRIRKIALAGYTLKGSLPQGLTFDSTTGTISGTVSNTFTTHTDTVTAFNPSGFSSTIITFTYLPLSNDIIYCPNAFTPNGDGRNDIWEVEGENIQSLKFYIYDQWGELLFTSTSKQNGWDGTYRGTKEPVGTYVYYLNAVMDDGQNIKRKGTIALLK
jgi:gliding motility-associated-like protein